MRSIGILLLVLSAMLFTASLIMGQVTVALLVFIPVFVFEGPLGVLSIVLFMISIVLLLISGLRSRIENGPDKALGMSNVDTGGIVFIGPIPIVFGSGELRKRFPRWWLLLLVGIVIFLLMNLFFLMFYFLSDP